MGFRSMSLEFENRFTIKTIKNRYLTTSSKKIGNNVKSAGEYEEVEIGKSKIGSTKYSAIIRSYSVPDLSPLSLST